MIDQIILMVVSLTAAAAAWQIFQLQKQLLNMQVELERIKMRLELLELK